MSETITRYHSVNRPPAIASWRADHHMASEAGPGTACTLYVTRAEGQGIDMSYLGHAISIPEPLVGALVEMINAAGAWTEVPEVPENDMAEPEEEPSVPEPYDPEPWPSVPEPENDMAEPENDMVEP